MSITTARSYTGALAWRGAVLWPLATAAVLAVSACSWGIKLDSSGRQVRTAWDGQTSGCQELGKVTVSVLDRVGPVSRNDIKLRDELQTLARNEAAQMGADTIAPLGEPRDGSQSWSAWRCGAALPSRAATAPPAPQPSDEATETYPLRQD